MGRIREQAALGIKTTEHPTEFFPQTPAGYHWKLIFNVSWMAATKRVSTAVGCKQSEGGTSSEIKHFDKNARVGFKFIIS